MPDQKYDAGRQTIGALLSSTSPRIAVPDWQRSYAWEQAQVDTFWSDLTHFDSLYPSRNIENQEYFLGSIVLVTGGPSHALLDGQQRLATATILLSALRDARKVYKADAAARLQSKYISDYDDATDKTDYILTLNAYDREFFRAAIQDESASPPQQKLRSHGLIRKARTYFDTRIAEQYGLLGDGQAAFAWNLRMQQVLTDHMSLVVVTSSDEDNAASVFETLNDRGIGLSTPDLLRNLLLRKASSSLERQRIVDAWADILGTVEQISSVDQFLRHYWVSRFGDVKTRSLYREIKSTLTTQSINSLTFSQELAEASAVYRDLHSAAVAPEDLQDSLGAVRELAATVLYPALLSAHSASDGDWDSPELREFARSLVTVFIRHNVIGARESTVLESAVYKSARYLRATKDWGTALAHLLEVVPNRSDFEARFSRAVVKRGGTQRYLLKQLELDARETEEINIAPPSRVHVEHIYPQTPLPGSKWVNHASYINRLGNLTLLSRRLNTSIRNADFATKKAAAYTQSELKLTQQLTGFDVWTSQQVDQRQVQLAASALRIWPLPGDDDPRFSSPPGPNGPEEDLDFEDLPETPEPDAAQVND